MARTGRIVATKRQQLESGLEILVNSCNGNDFIRITAAGGEFIIVCYVGDDTADYSSKRFYDLSGREIARDEPGAPGSPAGWTLTDDGLYGVDPTAGLDPTDPWNNTYGYDGGGLGIPKCGSGISAKKQSGKVARYILNSAIEDETFQAFTWQVVSVVPLYDYTYNFVRQIDSLTYAPYSIYGPRPYFTKYLGDSVLTMIVPWASMGSTLAWDAYSSENYRDVIPKVHKIWKVSIADGSRVGTDVEDYGETNDAAISAVGYKEGEEHKVRLLRAKTDTWIGSLMAEPVREEIYSLTAGGMLEGETYHRCSNPASETCYLVDGWIQSGYATIDNDIRVPFAIDTDGAQTYVRIQKDDNFDNINTGVYCNDELIEESGWESVTKEHDGEIYGPILIRNTRYRIIQAHLDSQFKAVAYSKTVYVTHNDELLPYTALNSSVGDYCQVRRTMIQSYTTYHLAVNGVITDLDYSNYKREYRLTIRDVAYVGAPLDQVHGHVVQIPWVDAGYDKDGNPLGEDNTCVMRFDTNSAQGKLFVGFDVFPVEYRHDLVYDANNNLTLDYIEAVAAFPPSSDAIYATVDDRKWMLFKTSGELLKEIQPPQKPSGGHVNRINGVAVLAA